MSRIGKKPVLLPDGVKVSVQDRTVTVESGAGRLSLTHRPEVAVVVEGRTVCVQRRADDRVSRAMHGLTRALIQNMVQGLTRGFIKELELVGVGWSARVQGDQVHLNVGYADTRVVDVPRGVKVELAGARIKVSGADRQAVGQVAAQIRSHRPPEPYNGKGIKYANEQIIRKQGKAFVGGAG